MYRSIRVVSPRRIAQFRWPLCKKWSQSLQQTRSRVSRALPGNSLCAHIRGRCPRTGNDGLLRRANANGNLQDLRHLCGCGHLFRRTDLRRHSDDERSFSGRHSRPLRCAVWCRNILARERVGLVLPHRAVDVGGRRAHDQAGRTATDQSSFEPAESQARARTLDVDGDRVCDCVTVFLVGFRDCWLSFSAFPNSCRRRVAHRPQSAPKMFQLWGLSLGQKSYFMTSRKY